MKQNLPSLTLNSNIHLIEKQSFNVKEERELNEELIIDDYNELEENNEFIIENEQPKIEKRFIELFQCETCPKVFTH